LNLPCSISGISNTAPGVAVPAGGLVAGAPLPVGAVVGDAVGDAPPPHAATSRTALMAKLKTET